MRWTHARFMKTVLALVNEMLGSRVRRPASMYFAIGGEYVGRSLLVSAVPTTAGFLVRPAVGMQCRISRCRLEHHAVRCPKVTAERLRRVWVLSALAQAVNPDTPLNVAAATRAHATTAAAMTPVFLLTLSAAWGREVVR